MLGSLKNPTARAESKGVLRQTTLRPKGHGTSGTARTCGFTYTTTGRPCANVVAAGALQCRAGHPCQVPDPVPLAVSVLGGRPRVATATTGDGAQSGNKGRRATELLGLALASDDAEAIGLHADEVLADTELALILLGGPSPLEAARHAVVQRYGRVGALMVVGYEDRFSRRVADEAAANAHPHDDHGVDPGDVAGRCLERLLHEFPTLDADEVEALLGELDAAEGRLVDDEATRARRWLHVTYAVAGRDGSDQAHHAYMAALDGVMSLTRSLIAS